MRANPLYVILQVPRRPLLTQYPVSEWVSLQPVGLGFSPKRESMKIVQSWPEALQTTSVLGSCTCVSKNPAKILSHKLELYVCLFAMLHISLVCQRTDKRPCFLQALYQRLTLRRWTCQECVQDRNSLDVSCSGHGNKSSTREPNTAVTLDGVKRAFPLCVTTSGYKMNNGRKDRGVLIL